MNADAALWSVDTYLLAAVADLLAAANWQRGGGKGQRPKQIPRPVVKTTTAKRVYTLDQIDDLLGWESPRS